MSSTTRNNTIFNEQSLSYLKWKLSDCLEKREKLEDKSNKSDEYNRITTLIHKLEKAITNYKEKPLE